MRHVISIHHLYQTGLNVKDLYSIPDLSVAHWFRLRRNTLLDGSQVFLLSLFFLPSYTNVSHMETPPRDAFHPGTAFCNYAIFAHKKLIAQPL